MSYLKMTMLTFYTANNNSIHAIPQEKIIGAADILWVDMLCPTIEEEQFIEQLFSTEIPTQEEMKEIELSSRLYQQGGAIYATSTIIFNADSDLPESHAITFVLVKNSLITLRYVDPKPFKNILPRIEMAELKYITASNLLAILLESVVDRMADILEAIARNIDEITYKSFRPDLKNKKKRLNNKPDLEELMRQIGVNGNLVSKTRESMISLTRLLGFISQTNYFKTETAENIRLQTLLRDIPALSDHALFLSGRVAFLLDATLGMISIEQNAIIKIFSIAAVMFLPPTLIASIYGMNFHHMPELDWHYGYPIAITLMVLAGWLPYKFFKHKNWL